MEHSIHIVVVGTCASGKSTLVSALRERGYDAYVCAQEHSGVPDLWNHLVPDLVIFLETDLASIRSRRSPAWPEAIYRAQRRRLLRARAAADIIINTGVVGVVDSVRRIERLADRRFQSPASSV